MRITRRALLATSLLAAAPKPKLDRSRLSVMTDEVGRDLADAIGFAKQYKLSWVELRGETGAGYYDAMPADKLKEAARRLADNGLRCSFLNSALLKFTLPGTIAVKSEAFYENLWKSKGWTPESMWADRMSTLNRCLDAAELLGTKQLRSFTFWRVQEPRSTFPKLKEALQEMGEAAAKCGCRILIENEFACNMASSAETASVLKMLKGPGIALNWDPQNSVKDDTNGVYPAGFKLLPVKRIANVQLKAEGLIGAGPKLDWQGITNDLHKAGFTGLYGLETHTLKGPAINIPASHKCLEAMLRLVGESA
jgi:L-ribulose-5-phosphate 3-epimerase